MQGSQVRPLVREPNPTCLNSDPVQPNKYFFKKTERSNRHRAAGKPSPRPGPHRLQVPRMHVALHQEAVDVPHTDAAVQVRLLQKQLALPDRLLGVLRVGPAGNRDSLSPSPARGCLSRGRAGPWPGGCSFVKVTAVRSMNSLVSHVINSLICLTKCADHSRGHTGLWRALACSRPALPGVGGLGWRARAWRGRTDPGGGRAGPPRERPAL